MAEEKPAKNWLKTIGTSIFGLMSGAVLMYVSPLVNSVVKPPKPLANFAQQPQGLDVTFINHSTNATQGWWDFGDGSPLEPFNPDRETVAHKYPRAGVYTAKLSLRSLFGDENERSVSINLEPSDGPSPTIEALQYVPLKNDMTAPVTVRVVSALKNAELSVWSAGDNRPLEITHDPSSVQDRLVTFTEPGDYTLRLVAVKGKQTTEKTANISVKKGNEAHAHVALNVTFEAVRVTREEKLHHRMIVFPADQKGTSYAFKKELHPQPGCQVAEVRLVQPVNDPAVKDVKVEISPDKSKAYLSGELVKTAGVLKKNVPLPSWHAEVVLVQEEQTAPQTKKADPVMVSLNLPAGTDKAVTVIPLPTLTDRWAIKHRQVTLEVRSHKQIVWSESKLPFASTMTINNKVFHVNVGESNGNVRLELQEIKPGETTN